MKLQVAIIMTVEDERSGGEGRVNGACTRK